MKKSRFLLSLLLASALLRLLPLSLKRRRMMFCTALIPR